MHWHKSRRYLSLVFLQSGVNGAVVSRNNSRTGTRAAASATVVKVTNDAAERNVINSTGPQKPHRSAVLAKWKHMARLQTRSRESRGGPGKCQEIGLD